MPPPGELAQAQYVLGVLVGRNDPPLLEAYLQTLAPGTHAEAGGWAHWFCHPIALLTQSHGSHQHPLFV